MKRITYLVAIIISLLGLSACANKSESSQNNKAKTSVKSNKSQQEGIVINGINWGNIDKNTQSELTVALRFVTTDSGVSGPMSPPHLIEQLSGNGGQGWTNEEAKRIVDMISPKINWNQIAVYAARNERRVNGVIGDQIITRLTAPSGFDSKTGNNYSNYGFTEIQAKYGVEHIDDTKKYPDISN